MNKIEEINILAKQFLSEKRYEKVLSVISGNLDPKDYDLETIQIIGIANFNLKDYKKALNVYLKLTSLIPDNHEFYYILSLIYFNLNEYLASVKSIAKALEIRPEHRFRRGFLKAMYDSNLPYEKLEKEIDIFDKRVGKSKTITY